MTTAVERPRLTVVRAARLFDGVGDRAVERPWVALDGDTITAIGSGDGGPEGTVVELPGATLLPGLIDNHVHLAFDASVDPVAALAGRDDEAVRETMITAARRAAAAGITTVRDLGDRGYLGLELRSAVETDPTLPTILVAGPPITTPDGHCHFLGGGAAGVDGLRTAVREHADRGVDVIKIMASGGMLTQGTKVELPQFSVAELRVVVEEAHRYGLPVTAHAHGLPAITDAVEAGVDGLEHVTFMTADGVAVPSDRLVSTLVDRRIVLGLTLGMTPVTGAALPPGIVSRLPKLIANLRRLWQAGAFTTISTDAGIAILKPHDVLPYAIGQVADLGIAPAEALRASTSRAAVACGLSDRKGRLAVGYDADLLAVAGDPLTDITALHDVRAVWLRGHRLP
ncbi:amidohydrolase family protein [Microlunatus speluncae]|uniref:amidohydrolase family protein n=1 Tax=Microlunatus speluncae TaxID=2594267 RepID=UPI0012660DD3|nr:amidohydrolase family protein [Microlunatus speluncae]